VAAFIPSASLCFSRMNISIPTYRVPAVLTVCNFLRSSGNTQLHTFNRLHVST